MFKKKTCLTFLENEALGFVLICHFEQDEASTGCFNVEALGMIYSYFLVTQSFISSDGRDFSSPVKEGSGLGFEASELNYEKSWFFLVKRQGRSSH